MQNHYTTLLPVPVLEKNTSFTSFLASILTILIKKVCFYFYEPTADLFSEKEALCIELINKYNMFK